MSSGSTNTVSEQLHEIKFTGEDFDHLRRALEGQQNRDENPEPFTGLGYWPGLQPSFGQVYQKVKTEKAYQKSIELQHKLILLKRLINQSIPKPAEDEPCNCIICSLERMVKKNGGVGIEVVVSKNGIEIPQDEPMIRDDPKGSHTES